MHSERHGHPVPRSGSGFTLIEMMITVAVLAIVTAVALPTYQSAMRKSRRSDGMSALSLLMQAEERYRANNASYYGGDLTVLLGGATADVSASGHYVLAVDKDSVGPAGYTATATARNTSPQYDDTLCRVLKVVVAGGTTVYSSSDAKGTANASATDPCWVK